MLGHEIGHVTARHSAQQITQQQLAGIGLGVASILSPTFQRYSGRRPAGARAACSSSTAATTRPRPTSWACDYATKAGYDPREIPDTYAMLRRVGERSGQRLPTFLSTHPDPGDREAAHDASWRAGGGAGKTGPVDHAARAYLERLDGVVYGDDPRHGYFEGTRFYHPELGFEITFPSGWQTQNTRTAVMAAAPDERGVMQLTLAPTSQGRSPAELRRPAQRRRARSPARAAARETIGGYAGVGRARSPCQTARTAGSARAGRRSSARSPDADVPDPRPQRSPGDADERAILASIRSFRALTDPRRGTVQPARVKVVTRAAAAARSRAS